MSLDKISAMLQQAMGLDQTSIGLGAIRSAMQKRMHKTEITDEESFLALLQRSPAEMTALIEEVVVPETWFFRNAEAFQLMQQHLTGPWRRAHPKRVPRLLSIPCSSGEEAYSMAMTLLDAGYTAAEFHIDAIDISNQHLHKAKVAVYGNSSFRGDQMEFRQRHFSKTDTGYALHDEVRQTVHFQHGNILDFSRMAQLGSYDIICCRNLLIYFDQNDRKRTAAMLDHMLTKDGLLFVGHAETGPMWKELFAVVPYPMAFAYRHRSNDETMLRSVPAAAKKTVMANTNKPPSALPAKPKLAHPTTPTTAPLSASMPPKGRTDTPGLDEVARLADRGQLDAARRQCEAYLHDHEAVADAWFILGLIDDSQNRKAQAKAAFRKVLYLQPDHYQALVHLALVLDQLGEYEAAQHTRERIQRVSKRQQAQATQS